MKRMFSLGLFFTMVVWTSICLAENDVVGVVQIASGGCTVIRVNQPIGVSVGQKLQENDILETGVDGNLGIVLRDDTLLSLGPNSRFILDRFAFSPAEDKLGFAARLSHGTIQMVSGKIAKMAPESIRIETPMALLGIRGTRFAAKVSQ